MADLERLREQVSGYGLRVVLPEQDDAVMAAAAEEIEASGIATVVALAETSEAHLAAVQAARPSMKPAVAEKMLARPLMKGGAMVAAGEADALVAGISVPTRRVIEAAMMTIGAASAEVVPASFFLMRFPYGRLIVFADCAVNLAPDAAELAGIGVAASEAASRLAGSGRTAFLSYATGGSGAGPSVDLVAEAVEMARAAGVDAFGPVQADAALNAEIGARKGIEGATPAALVFPSLDAGNIGYKLVQELAGAQAIGPILTGFAKPVADLSRGASVADIVATTVVTLTLAGESA